MAQVGRPRKQGPVIESEEQEEIAASVVGDVYEMQDQELPPEIRVSDRPAFDSDELLNLGLSPREILAMRQSSDNLVEYNEEEEIERLERYQRQQLTIQEVDAGPEVRRSHDAMSAYFKGGQPLKDTLGRTVMDEHGHPQLCKRYRYVSPEKIRVGINSYIFDIPANKPLMLPSEVIEILEGRARALKQFSVLSSIYTARLGKPMSEALDANTLRGEDMGLERFLRQ